MKRNERVADLIEKARREEAAAAAAGLIDASWSRSSRF
jgi:hypothetical protein